MYRRTSRRNRTVIAGLALATAASLPLALDADGASAEVRPICDPFPAGALGGRTTFGDARGGGTRSHAGHDLMGDKMEPLVAAASGVVEEALYSNSSGNRLAIRGDDGWRYVYLHLNNDTPGTDDGAATIDQVFTPGVTVGARVEAGQVVGYNGDSGNAESSGAHLHFEIRRPGDRHWSLAPAIDPYPSLVEAPDCTVAVAVDPAPFATVEDLVEQQYRDLLGREPDADGAADWVSRVTSGRLSPSGVAGGLLTSHEASLRTAPVARLYWTVFDRIPDSGGLDAWLGAYRSGTLLVEVAEAFVASSEFAQKYAGLDDGGFVTRLYDNVLGRSPDGAGLSYWTGELRSGRMTRAQVVVGFSESPEFVERIAVPATITVAYVAMLGRAPDAPGLADWTAQGIPATARGIFGSQEYRNRIEAASAD